MRKFILMTLVLVVMTACTTFKAETPAQRYFSLKGHYEQLLIAAVGYKHNCEARIIKHNCQKHVGKIQEINARIYDGFWRADNFRKLGNNEDLAMVLGVVSSNIETFSNYLINNNLGAK